MADGANAVCFAVAILEVDRRAHFTSIAWLTTCMQVLPLQQIQQNTEVTTVLQLTATTPRTKRAKREE